MRFVFTSNAVDVCDEHDFKDDRACVYLQGIRTVKCWGRARWGERTLFNNVLEGGSVGWRCSERYVGGQSRAYFAIRFLFYFASINYRCTDLEMSTSRLTVFRNSIPTTLSAAAKATLSDCWRSAHRASHRATFQGNFLITCSYTILSSVDSVKSWVWHGDQTAQIMQVFQRIS